jgi:hypothetical protein
VLLPSLCDPGAHPGGIAIAVDDYIRSAQEGLVNFSFLTDAHGPLPDYPAI